MSEHLSVITLRNSIPNVLSFNMECTQITFNNRKRTNNETEKDRTLY